MNIATHDDLPDLVGKMRDFHAAANQPFGFDPAATRTFLGNIIDNGVIFQNDSGMIGGIIAPSYCDPEWHMAVELFWWSEKGGLSLLAAFEQWASENGANECRMTSLASLERAGRLLNLKGYTPAEISYRRVI